MRGIILACRYKLPARLVPQTSHHELVSTFEGAVARVVLKHPHMHIGLVGEGTNKACWVRLGSINLQNHIQWTIVRGSANELQKTLLQVSNQQLDTKFIDCRHLPGWRINVLRMEGSDIIEVLLVFNHTNMDGTSAKIFHAELLQNLHVDNQTPNDSLLRDHVLTLPGDSTQRLSPPPETLVQFPVEPKAMMEFLKIETRTPAHKYPRSPAQAHWAPIQAAPFKTRFRSITAPKSVLSDLVQACHSHETTLTGLLHALILVSLTPLLEPSDATAFGFLTAMDIRRLLPPYHPSYPWFKADQAMSNYVTIVSHFADEDFVAQVRSKYSPDDSTDSRFETLMDLIWSAARKVREDFEAKRRQETKNDMIGFSQAIGDWRAQLIEHVRRPRPSSWVITNLGLIDGDPSASPSPEDTSEKAEQESSWSITRAQFLMCANVVSSAFGISMAAVKGGDLVIACNWQDCVVDGILAETFVKTLEKWLMFVVRYQNN